MRKINFLRKFRDLKVVLIIPNLLKNIVMFILGSLKLTKSVVGVDNNRNSCRKDQRLLIRIEFPNKNKDTIDKEKLPIKMDSFQITNNRKIQLVSLEELLTLQIIMSNLFKLSRLKKVTHLSVTESLIVLHQIKTSKKRFLEE